MKIILIIILIIFFSHQAISAQSSGGAFSITQSTIAPGGTINSAGGAFTLEAVIGQANAGGALQNPTFSVYSGFFTPAALAPTAANVSISGRVLLTGGQGVRNVLLTLRNSRGETRTALTGSFGYYHFTEVAAGETYILELRSNRYTFANPVRVINVVDEISDLDFVAEE